MIRTIRLSLLLASDIPSPSLRASSIVSLDRSTFSFFLFYCLSSVESSLVACVTGGVGFLRYMCMSAGNIVYGSILE